MRYLVAFFAVATCAVIGIGCTEFVEVGKQEAICAMFPNRPECVRPTPPTGPSDPYYGAQQPGSDPYYEAQQPGTDPYYEAQQQQPGTDPYYEAQQPGTDPYYGAEQPGTDPNYGAQQPGTNAPYYGTDLPSGSQPPTPAPMIRAWPILPVQQPSAGGAASTVSFAWSNNGPIRGMFCVQFHESREVPAHGWGDNYLCASQDVGLRWSSNGPIPGYRCTQISEGREPPATSWHDNFVCVPGNSPIRFRYQSNGPIPGMRCVQLNEPRDPHTWNDNYLCY